MRLTRSTAERDIAEEVRSFLATHMSDPMAAPVEFDERIAWLREWQRELHQAGLVNVAWPKEHGGRGATLGEQMVVEEELARAGAPELIAVVGLGVVGPSIVAHGTDEQQARWLPKILSGEEIWCQGFSEPSAGSDLASLRTVAEDRGDHWVVRGQKTWTSWAQYARWCAVLARTDPDVSPHRGISYLVADMQSPGVEVRPLVQLTGEAEFSEVYFDDVVVAKDQIIGECNAGWGIAMHTLSHERGPAVAARAVKLRVLLDQLIADARRLERDGQPVIEDQEVRTILARTHVQLEVLRCQSARTVGTMVAKGRPGLETSIDKLALTRAEQLLGDAALTVLGPAAPYADPDGPADIRHWQGVYLYARAASIYGGASQVQKNIIAERILGLPPELAMDLELGEEQLELRAAAVGMLDRYAPLSLARRYLEGHGAAGDLWAQIGKLGWLEVGLDVEDPFGVPGLCLLAEQVGRHAAPTTLVDTALFARVAAVAGGRMLEHIVAGDPTLALAMLEPARSWSTSTTGTLARRDGGAVLVSGEKTGVHHAADVGLLAVVVALDGSPALALVQPNAAGVTITPLSGLDPSCAPCRVSFDNVRVPGSDVLAGPAVETALPHALDVAAVATTAEGLGAASAALDMAVSYSLQREQYGRPIGAFQGLAHLIAEQHCLRETAWASVLYAAAALDERTEDAPMAAAVAKAHGAAATKSVAEGALQVFGGVGFTREHDLHLLYRRALECAGRFGGVVEHERRVAAALLSPEPALAGR